MSLRGTSTSRVCECGCGSAVVARRATTKYIDARHRQRAYRSRVKKAADAAGVPANVSLQTVEATGSTRPRNGDGRRPGNRAQQRKPQRRHGVTVYYPSLPAAVIAANLLPVDLAEPIRKAIDRARAKAAA